MHCRTNWKEWLSNKSPRSAGKYNKKKSSNVSVTAAPAAAQAEGTATSRSQGLDQRPNDVLSSPSGSLGRVQQQLSPLR